MTQLHALALAQGFERVHDGLRWRHARRGQAQCGLQIGPRVCLIAGALRHTREVLQGLEVDAEAMRRNIDMTHGLVMSEAVMMGLGRHIGREHAHDLVYDLCRQASVQKRPLLDILCENAEIMEHVDREQLAAMCDPMNYLGQSGAMVDRVLAQMGG